MPGEVENHLMECYVSDVIAVLDTLEIERAAFWGYSSGCWVGYALAATHPERVEALIASGAIGPRDYAEPEERSDAQRKAGLLGRHGSIAERGIGSGKVLSHEAVPGEANAR